MEESTTYQAIISKGQVQELRRTLLLQGDAKFGPADSRVASTIESLNDIEDLERLAIRMVHAASWEELLDLPAPLPHPRRRKPRS